MEATATPEVTATSEITSTLAPPELTPYPKPTSLNISTWEQLIDLFWWMIYNGTREVRLDGLSVSREVLLNVRDKFSNYFDSLTYSTGAPRVSAEFKPGLSVLLAIQKGEVDALDDECRTIADQAQKAVAGLIRPDMTDFEKELAIHDYVISNCGYMATIGGFHVEDARGFFQQGLCQCSGCVDTFRLLGRLAGLEVEMIGSPTTRDAPNSKGRAWNLIRLDGQWYVVDVTWDDIADSASVMEHTFFNLACASFGDTRSWDQSCCPAGEYAAAVDGNCYYSRNGYPVRSEADALASAIRQLDAGGRAYLCFPETDCARQVSAGLVEYYRTRGKCTELSEDLDLALYRFTMR